MSTENEWPVSDRIPDACDEMDGTATYLRGKGWRLNSVTECWEFIGIGWYGVITPMRKAPGSSNPLAKQRDLVLQFTGLLPGTLGYRLELTWNWPMDMIVWKTWMLRRLHDMTHWFNCAHWWFFSAGADFGDPEFTTDDKICFQYSRAMLSRRDEVILSIYDIPTCNGWEIRTVMTNDNNWRTPLIQAGRYGSGAAGELRPHPWKKRHLKTMPWQGVEGSMDLMMFIVRSLIEMKEEVSRKIDYDGMAFCGIFMNRNVLQSAYKRDLEERWERATKQKLA